MGMQMITTDVLKTATVNPDGELTITLADGTPVNAGPVKGLPGVNAVPADEAVATYVTDPTAQSHQAVAGVLAANPEVVSAAAELAQSDAGLVLKGDARLPSLRDADEEILATVTDESGKRTFLEASAVDGAPTEWSRHLLRDSLGMLLRSAPGVLATLTDSAGRMTHLTVRDTDGQFPDWVIQDIQDRMKVYEQPMYVDAPYSPEANVLPVSSDSAQLAGWGSSTMGGLDSQLSSLAAAHSMSWFPGGTGWELVEHTAARSNAVPAELMFPDRVVPASGEVTVGCDSMPVLQYMRRYAGTITTSSGAVVHGELYSTTDEFRFVRSDAGDAVPVDASVKFTADDGLTYRNATTLLQVGKNNLTRSDKYADPDHVVDYTIRMARQHAALHKRVLVIGQFINTGTPAIASVRTRINAVNADLRHQFGAVYLDVAEWLASPDLWTETGLTPTEADLSEQALGNLPPSVSANSGHFNDAGYKALRDRIEQKLTSLGWI